MTVFMLLLLRPAFGHYAAVTAIVDVQVSGV